MGGKKRDTHLYPAKITRPTCENALLRKRLFKHIDRARKKPVLWLSGPAGSGKTTLVSSYINDRTLPCLWYRFNALDNDIATFFHYLGLAAKRANPRKRKPLPHLTPEYMMGVDTFGRRYFEELFGRLKAPALVVLDNYHDLSPDSPVHRMLAGACSLVPDGLNMVIISRDKPASQFVRQRANGLIDTIGWDMLRLLPEETARIAKAWKVPKKKAYELHKKTDGWTAGLVLMLQHMASGPGMDALPGNIPQEQVFEYFSEEVFLKASPEQQRFLLETSLLGDVTVRMSEELTGIAHSRDILYELHRKNYFTEKHSASEPVFQYHPLFREFLLQGAAASYESDEITGLKRKAAYILEKEGRNEEAAGLFIDACEWHALAALALRNAGGMLGQGRNRTLLEWLQNLPEQTAEDSPWILYWKAVALFPFNPPESKGLHERAFHAFSASHDAAGMFLSWDGIVNAIIFGFTELNELDSWVPLLEELLRSHKIPSPEIEGIIASGMFNALSQMQPNHPEIELWRRKVSAHLDRVEIVLRSLPNLLLFHVMRGEFTEANGLIRRLAAFSREYDIPFLRAMQHILEVIYYLYLPDPERCMDSMELGLVTAQKTGIHLFDFFFHGYGAACALCRGDMHGAGELLSKNKVLLDRARPGEINQYYCIRSWKLYLLKDYRQSSECAEKALAYARELGSPHAAAMTLMTAACAKYAMNAYDGAVERLSEAAAISEENNLILRFGCRMIEAWFSYERDRGRCLQILRSALRLGSGEGIFSMWAFMRPDIAKLCVLALEAGIEKAFVLEFVRRHQLYTEISPVHLEDWPWPLKIYTLGRFSILRDDVPVRTEGRAQKKPVEMLKAIIALGGRQVREESITDILWPDAAGDDAHNAFTTTMSRLRKILGTEGALEVREGRVTLKQNVCWVDAWAFERLIGEADREWKEGDSGRARMLAERAFGMYTGPFLSGEDEHWSVSPRERLKSKFLRNVLNVGKYLEESRQWDEALGHYVRGLEVDELIEEFYRRAMQCCMHLERKAEAVSVFKRCRETFGRVLGLEPSRETEEMFRRIQG